jgi:hypothetical protein
MPRIVSSFTLRWDPGRAPRGKTFRSTRAMGPTGPSIQPRLDGHIVSKGSLNPYGDTTRREPDEAERNLERVDGVRLASA